MPRDRVESTRPDALARVADPVRRAFLALGAGTASLTDVAAPLAASEVGRTDPATGLLDLRNRCRARDELDTSPEGLFEDCPHQHLQFLDWTEVICEIELPLDRCDGLP